MVLEGVLGYLGLVTVTAQRTLLLLLVSGATIGCGDDLWDVTATVAKDHILIAACISDLHGDYIHMSIRKQGHKNGYTVKRSPAPGQPHRDWSRVHHWFGEMHPDTYLEGRIDDGSGEGPTWAETYTFRIPRGKTSSPRQDYADEGGSDYVYITYGYPYADGNYQHPEFDSGTYEIEIYAWYTGSADDSHPAADGSEGVQYIHYDSPLATTGGFKVD